LIEIPNDPASQLPSDLSPYQQILLEKQTLDIFEAVHADDLVNRLPADAEFVVFGVVTEYCVRFAAKGLLSRGRRVSIVKDAIETLKAEDAARTIVELQSLGAKFITTGQALALLDAQQ
jgi:nicotinamidase/pyrazinamidase